MSAIDAHLRKFRSAGAASPCQTFAAGATSALLVQFSNDILRKPTPKLLTAGQLLVNCPIMYTCRPSIDIFKQIIQVFVKRKCQRW
eukprot:CAMPEP_0114280920 /NCGR_PEP_ID=MMETSP0059-20121206/2702_1 /TAXON_ID=36894 /ORGANISM="Pyramimonas parkeae, Strain CCMP726" /LENGTH=85 /DNA_ID=CAMNT_0001401367 /DNA_START=371 /DNA_END=628 /DNA_ORIENTATION=+